MSDHGFSGAVYEDYWDKEIIQPCSCCGARVIPKDKTYHPHRRNYLTLSRQKKNNYQSADGKREVVCLETKNGPLTLGMRYEW